MRNRLILLLSAFAAMVAISTQGFAQGNIIKPEVQTGFLVGPIGGINLVAYNTDVIPVLNLEPTCFNVHNGSDIAAWGGVSVEFPMGNPNELQSFIIGEVLYDSKSSKFTNGTNAAAAIPTKLNGYYYSNSSVQTSETATLAYFEVNLAYKYNFTPGPSPVGPGIQAGPVIGINATAKYNKTVTVTSVSPNATANEQSVVQSVTNSTNVNSNGDNLQTLRIALRAAATYDLSFSNEWIATPIVGYDFPITKVESNYNWRASALFAGIAFRYFIKG